MRDVYQERPVVENDELLEFKVTGNVRKVDENDGLLAFEVAVFYGCTGAYVGMQHCSRARNGQASGKSDDCTYPHIPPGTPPSDNHPGLRFRAFGGENKEGVGPC